MNRLILICLMFLCLLLTACTEDVNRAENLQYQMKVLDRFDQPANLFQTGEEIRVRLIAKNIGNDTETLYFNTSQEADFEWLAADGSKVWRWSDEQGFLDALHQREVPPQGQLEAGVTICEGAAPQATQCPELSAGRYVVRAWFLGTGVTSEVLITLQ